MAFDDPLKATVVAEIAAKIEDNMTKNITPQELREVLTSCLNFAENGEDSDKIIEGAVNIFMTAAQNSKLDGIAAGAEVNPSVVSQVEAEAGVATTERIWTAQRVKQAIDALGGGGGGGADYPALDATIQSASFTAVVGRIHPVDASGGAITINPPSSPNVGDQFGITDVRRSFLTNTVGLRFFSNSQRFCGDSTVTGNIILAAKDSSYVFEYHGASFGWAVLAAGKIT